MARINAENVYLIMKEDIEKGKCGKSGEQYYTVRLVAEKYGVSYVTAQKLSLRLRDEGYVMLSGKKAYLTYGRMEEGAPLAQAIQKQNSVKKRVGLHINTVNNIFFASIAEKLQAYLEKKGYELIIMSSCGSYENEKKTVATFVEFGVEGIISFPGHDENWATIYKNCILPVLLVGTDDREVDIPAVFVDNRKGAKMAAKHLAECGYKTFGYVGTKKLGMDKDIRLAVFDEALKGMGKNINNNVFFIDSQNPKESRGELKSFILKSEKPLGLFCYHDGIAAEVYSICRQYKLKIPQEVGVVGFDDLPIADMMNPKLTTIAYRYDVMAERAVDTLLDIINHKDIKEKKQSVRPVLTVRDSTVAGN